MTEEKKTERRSEKSGIAHFSKEMISALLMAFVFIIYVIQAFRIPTGSMEKSLMIGDFLLGLKFVYGAPVLPFTYMKFPGIADPKPGDVVIFKYPGNDNKDYIKRCIAGPGQTIEIHKKKIIVDGKQVALPPDGQYTNNGSPGFLMSDFKPLYIPKSGDTIFVDSLPVREFLFLKHLIHQENPRKEVSVKLQLYIDGEFANGTPVTSSSTGRPLTFDDINFNIIDNWPLFNMTLQRITDTFKGRETSIEKYIYIDDKPVKEYVVRKDNYFMMGDNRDNSLDSRYWGYLNRKFVKAKAFIIYFSLKSDVPFYLLPLKIRWDRIGKLIRSYYVTQDVEEPAVPVSKEPIEKRSRPEGEEREQNSRADSGRGTSLLTPSFYTGSCSAGYQTCPM